MIVAGRILLGIGLTILAGIGIHFATEEIRFQYRVGRYYQTLEEVNRKLEYYKNC